MSFSHFPGIISDPGLMSEWVGNAEILAHFPQSDFLQKVHCFWIDLKIGLILIWSVDACAVPERNA